MKSCSEITELLSEGQDRKLSFFESLATRTHLMMCRGCRHYSKQLDFLRNAVRAYADGNWDKKNPDA
jgi:predicted anti-sigma-YlaC factor YlaD